MAGPKCDMLIAGGGLSGGLIALALARRRPDLTVRLVEAGQRPGGNHRWSWFASDLDEAGAALIEPVRKVEWADGYEVIFPAHGRVLDTSYRSIHSADFADALERELAAGTILAGTPVDRLDGAGAVLADGSRVEARAVVDCRGLTGSAHLTGGWQVFMGRHLRLASAHGLTRPIIMDACVEQAHGYRFVYVLPLSADEIFVEDTYYQDTPALDERELGRRLDAYQSAHFWKGEIVSEETGVLPVITGGDFAAFDAENRLPGVALAGARGGFVHPLTSYTLPFAVRTALLVADNADRPGDELAQLLRQHAHEHWRATRFYRLLGAMLLGAARPPERYRVFERFYRLPQGLIERFYAARSTPSDRIRILAGRPPVPVSRAIAALARRQAPLAGANPKDRT